MRAVFLWCLALFLIAAPGCASVENVSPAEMSTRDLTAVITVGGGHGSGTLIGSGMMLTAAHVVVGRGDMTIKTVAGKEYPAELAWSPRTDAADGMDVAVLSVQGTTGVARIDCRPLMLGEPFFFHGNPSHLRAFLSRGYVASTELIGPDSEPEKYRVQVSGMLNPGDSGAAIFNDKGDIRGIVNAFIPAQMGMFGLSQSGNGIVVPASSFCDAMPDVPGLTKVRG